MTTASSPFGPHPVAIIGIGCRFPGGASDPEGLWQMLREGRDAIADAPARVGLDRLYHPDHNTPGRVHVRRGGFLDEVAGFDAGFFGISPREAARMDPQHRLLLMAAWEALEDGGVAPSSVAGRAVGVFVGASYEEYYAHLLETPEAVDVHATSGGVSSVAAGRVSFNLDLRGPSMSLDTACSSSLVATHLACRSLDVGESEMAIAAGVCMLLRPEPFVGYSTGGMLAYDARCKSFDARGDGFVRSEGVGVVVLQPLDRALAEGRRIYAVIRGGATNNDGASSGYLMTPGQGGQSALLHAALRDAAVAPAEVGYVECHGTGTRAGDPVEVGALTEAYDVDRVAPLRIGSIKSNIGHTEPAAGIAGLIKTALAVHHGEIPPSLNFEQPNPQIPWDSIGLEVATAPTPWPAEAPLAGVNAFGIGGSNAHLVLQPAPAPRVEGGARVPGAHLLVLSGPVAEARRRQAERWGAWLAAHPDVALDAVGRAAAVGRQRHRQGLAAVADDAAEMAEVLSAYARDGVHPQVVEGTRARGEGPGRVAFICPGQGAQWIGMGRALLADDGPFARRMAEVDVALKAVVGWSVIEVLQSDAEDALSEVAVIQPSIFAVQVALAAWWRAMGIEPDGVVGHSMGEAAAACIAGALSLSDAALMLGRRSGYITDAAPPGRMAVVGLDAAAAAELIAPYDGRLEVAVLNGPTSNVVAGDPEAISALVAELEGKEIFCREVAVTYASHTHHMDVLIDGLRERAAEVAPRDCPVEFWSTVHAAKTPGSTLDAEYWCANMRRAVRFQETIEALVAAGYDTFIELSPHPTLHTAMRATLEATKRPHLVAGSLDRKLPERVALARGLGAVALWGHTPDADALYGAHPHVALPPYAWTLTDYWLDDVRGGIAPAEVVEGHPLLAAVEPVALGDGFAVGRTTLSAGRMPWVVDHRVADEPIMPTTAWVEACLALGRDAGLDRVADLEIHASLPLPPGRQQRVQLTVRPRGGDRLVRVVDGEGAPLMTARLTRGGGDGERLDLDAIRARCAEGTADDHYAVMARRGLDYGPIFRGITGLHRRDGEALVSVALAGAARHEAADFVAHPALLDACLQAIVSCLPTEGDDVWLPVSVGLAELSGAADRIALAHATLDRGADGVMTGGVRLLDADGRVLGRMEGVGMRPLAPDEADADLLHWRWRAVEAIEPAEVGGRWQIEGPDAAAVADGLAKWGITRVEAGDPAALDGAIVLATTDDGAELPDAFLLVETVQRWTKARGGAPWRLLVVTRGAYAIGDDAAPDPAHAALAALGRVIAREHAEITCRRVDLPAGARIDADAIAAALAATGDDDEWAIRRGERWVPRLDRQPAAPRPIAIPAGPVPTALDGAHNATLTPGGALSEMRFTRAPTPRPGPDEVVVAVEAAGINFIDVLTALDRYTDRAPGALGLDGAGVVVAVGERVTRRAVGDRVFFATSNPHPALARLTVAHAALTWAMPDGMTTAEAAGLPIVWLTALLGLDALGRLRSGETVLIHSATGGTGRAALAVARARGATVLATAGSDARREALRGLGVEHVFDSRSASFVEGVRAATGGRGVDVVLNSLSGDLLEAGLSLLAPGGRFIEIGKADMAADRLVGLGALAHNRMFASVDLLALLGETPARLGALLDAALEEGLVEAAPTTPYPASRAGDAFADMAAARHRGKLVLDLTDPALTYAPPQRAAVPGLDGPVLITGGLGGLGLAIARWLVEHGARELALMSRSGPRPAVEEALAELRAAGATVTTPRGDVAVLADVERVVAEVAPAAVIHAAGVLEDAIVLRQDAERFAAALAPKVAGAWNLHRATRGIELSHFVLFSSAAVVLGSPGQSNYVTGNAFMDALAEARRAEGRAALSIAWGTWDEVGLAARPDRGGRLARRGVAGFSPREGAEVFGRALAVDAAWVGAARFDAEQWRESGDGRPEPLLADLADSTPTHDATGLDAPPGPAREAAIREALAEQVAHVLAMPPDALDRDAPVGGMGIDSLMAVDLKNRIARRLDVDLPVLRLLRGPSVSELAAGIEADLVAAEAAAREAEALIEQVDDLDEDQMDALLAELLEQDS